MKKIFFFLILLIAQLTYAADQYDGLYLSIPEVQVNNTIYSNVKVTIKNILSVGGVAPSASLIDTYTLASNELFIPVVQAYGKTYNNVRVQVGDVVSVGATRSSGTFAISSSLGNALAALNTCDGMGVSPDLQWSNVPSGTKEFALLMKTVAPNETKYNWVLYSIPASITSLNKDSFGIGLNGVGSDGPFLGYQAPCSQGPGVKVYTFTIYALSASPVLGASTPSGLSLLNSISSITIASASLDMSYNAPGPSGLGQSGQCNLIKNSVKGSKSGTPSVSCDGTYAYIGSNGLTSDSMMTGITATNLQVPIAQNFIGANAWKIPLNPQIAASPTSVLDGPIGVAINGIPIFNPCKQGGCQNANGGGDTKALGELDICNGHAGRADDYHYHAAPTCLMSQQTPSYWDTHPVGWALDGFAIFGYNDGDGHVAERDRICGGNSKTNLNAPAGYSYHVTDTSPYVLSCLIGVPSPDLINQSSKYSPLRKPPVDPLPKVSSMSLSSSNAEGYSILEFTSGTSFNTTPDNSSNYSTINASGTYQIWFKPLSGISLTNLLTMTANKGKTACWEFQFINKTTNQPSQPTESFCK